jgi:hypothetical protein
MKQDEALGLLAWGLPLDQVATQAVELRKLAARLGEWDLLLKLVNGFLRDRVVDGKESLARAIEGVSKRLEARGLIAFDAREEVDRTTAVARTIGVSLELLKDDDRSRFGELGIFPEDGDVPIGIVACLWRQTGGLDEDQTEDLLRDLHKRSLLLNLDFDRHVVRLHDTVRHFLRDGAGQGEARNPERTPPRCARRYRRG